MKKTEETETKYSCEFCNRKFVREKTLFTHICETKRRWLEKDSLANRLGFQSFVQFYKKHTSAKHTKTYDEFIRSPYYTAFVKFGSHCSGINAVNIPRFVDYLLANQVSIDNWTSDKVYTEYLVDHLKKEDPFDAICRSVETTFDLAEKDNIQAKDLFRFGNINRICHAITTGKISPWMLYCSDSGIQFLENLNQDHVKIVSDYINPEQWALKFHRDNDLHNKIKQTLREAGY